MPNDAAFSALLARVRAGDAEAERQLTEDNMPLVYAIAKRYAGRGVEQDDLFQLGAIGLLKAIRKFDPGFGVCFSTYAVPLIAGEIKRFLRDDGAVKYSRSIKELAGAVRALLEREPDAALPDLAAALHIDEAEAAAALSCMQFPRSLDEPDRITGDPIGDSIPAKSEEADALDRITVQALLASLDERERTLVQLRYFADRTQAEVGRALGVSQVQVSRLEKRILTKLREGAERQEKDRSQ